MIEINPLSLQAYRLMHEGILAFGRAERHGIRIDEKYLKKTHKKLTKEADALEEEFQATKFYKQWDKSVNGKPNINSPKQLEHFLYTVRKHPIKKKTKTGKGSTDEKALKGLKIPALDIYLKKKKVENLRDTFLASLARESVNGIMHPSFGLHIPVTYRGSSYDPNFQNLPKRDPKAMKTIRGAIYPSKGNQLLEVDYGGVEVCIGEAYHEDKTMLKYITDPKTDMHRDMAQEIFRLKKFDQDSKMHDFLRSATKNGFVFPEFYGDYYKPCAESLICGWGEIEEGKFKPKEGVKKEGLYLSDLLIKNGFKNYTSFENHIKDIEKDFWGKRFKGYAKWKDDWYADYMTKGYIDMKTGFRCSGVMTKNHVTNYPIQGAAFHCLLWSFIQLDKVLYSGGWKSRLIGQIHDSLILDVYPPELEKLMKIIQRITTVDLRKHWDWINVPLIIDAEICGIDKSWAEKNTFKF